MSLIANPRGQTYLNLWHPTKPPHKSMGDEMSRNLFTVTPPSNRYTAFMQDASDIQVSALWDEEAGVWVATSDHVPGLVTESATLEELLDELKLLIPELLELNGRAVPSGDLPVNLVAQRTVHVPA